MLIFLIRFLVYWLHTLCKNIELVSDRDGNPRIEDPRKPSHGSFLSQDDGTWRRSGYFMRWKQPPKNDDSSGTMEFVIFSASQILQRNIERLVTRPDWEQALADPFSLLVIVLDDITTCITAAIDKVLIVFRPIEHVGLLPIK